MREGHAKLAREWGEWSGPESGEKSTAVAHDVGKAAATSKPEAASKPDSAADDLAAGVAGVKLDDAPATPSKIMREEPSRAPAASADQPAAKPTSEPVESAKPAAADKRAAM